MNDFVRAPTQHTAMKPHQCVYCGEMIERADPYYAETGYYDGRAFRNRFHPECFDERGEQDFVRFANDRPTK
jgi:hypothetical protein